MAIRLVAELITEAYDPIELAALNAAMSSLKKAQKIREAENNES